MANNSVTYQIFNSIVKAVKPLGVKVYLQNRPKEKKYVEGIDKFLVIDIPTSIDNTCYGNDDYHYRTIGVIYALVRSHTDGTPNIDAQTSFVRNIFDLFPYKDEIVECVNPNVLLRGLDDFGFQITTITFTLRTRVNAFAE